MYNNGYMNGLTSKVTLAMRSMQTSVDNRRFANGLNKPKVVTPKDREIPKRGINDPYAPKVTTRPSRILEDVYFRLVCTKVYFGDISTKDSMIVKFKDERGKDIKLKDIDSAYQRYFEWVCTVAKKYGAGVIKNTPEGIKVVGKAMKKTYIEEGEQKRLLYEGYARQVRDKT